MDRDRNLLFGVFAVQLRKVTASQIMEAAAAWATDPSKDLPERLVANNAITAKTKRLLDRLIADAIGEHDGDVSAALETFGGEEQVYRSFHGSISISAAGEYATRVQAATAGLAGLFGVVFLFRLPRRYWPRRIGNVEHSHSCAQGRQAHLISAGHAANSSRTKER